MFPLLYYNFCNSDNNNTKSLRSEKIEQRKI